jgi:GTPase KRas protein
MVGKSSLIHLYVRETIVMEYDATIEDSFRKHILIHGKKHFLDILDTSGLEDYNCLQEQQIGSANGFLLMYDTSSLESFEAMKEYFDRIYEIKDCWWVPVILIGNHKINQPREVSHEDGVKLASSLGVPFFELNIKDVLMSQVEEIFDTLALTMKSKGIVFNEEINFVKKL